MIFDSCQRYMLDFSWISAQTRQEHRSVSASSAAACHDPAAAHPPATGLHDSRVTAFYRQFPPAPPLFLSHSRARATYPQANGRFAQSLGVRCLAPQLFCSAKLPLRLSLRLPLGSQSWTCPQTCSRESRGSPAVPQPCMVHTCIDLEPFLLGRGNYPVESTCLKSLLLASFANCRRGVFRRSASSAAFCVTAFGT
jgi:hypothetical protein